MRWPRSDGCTMTVSSSIRAPSIGAIRLCRSTSVEHRPVQRDEHEAVHRRLGQLQAAVAAHGVDDVDQQRLRDGVAREADERVDDLLRVVPGGAGVPQRERGDAVGVDVLGRAFELGERGDRRAGLGGGRDGRPRAAGSCRTGRSGARRARRIPSYGLSTGRGGVAARGSGDGATPSAPGEERHAGRGTPGDAPSKGLHSSTENARMPRRSYRAPPAIALPERACRGPEWSRVGSAGRPTRPDEKVRRSPDELRRSPPAPAPVPARLRRPSSTAGRAHLGSRRSQTVGPRVSECGRTSSATAGRTRVGGRGRDQHRDQNLLVGPTEPAQLAAGLEAGGGRAGARAARDRARGPPRRGPGPAASELGSANRLLEVARPGAPTRPPPCASNATGPTSSSPSGVWANRGPLHGRHRAARTARSSDARTGIAAANGLDAATRTAVEQAEGGFAQLLGAARRRRRLGAAARRDRSSSATPASSPARTCWTARCCARCAPPGCRARRRADGGHRGVRGAGPAAHRPRRRAAGRRR